MTVIFITSPTGSNQTWTVPADWTDINTVECLGGGATGNAGSSGVRGGGGGGGGGYAKSVNLTGFIAGGSVTVRVGAVGGSTWFNATSFPISGQACGGIAGATPVGAGGGAGGVAGSCYFIGSGSFGKDGGAGGIAVTAAAAGGGGGGGAPLFTGNGAIGSNAVTTTGGAGGNADAGVGGAGGASSTSGSAGLEYGALGAGGGGGGSNSNGGAAGTGGLYGAGGGGGNSNTQLPGGLGTQGLIVITYVQAQILPNRNLGNYRYR